MSESRWGKPRDNTVPVVLVALIIGLFLTTASLHGRMADMESRLGTRIDLVGDQVERMEQRLLDQLDRVEQRLSDQLTRLGP